ncbi:MAG: hypothetical protein RLO52_06105 [Sandaracinaceae bacterium]|nr:MAG: hypothetical protein EVA89_26070 [Sandaracinaceae bacterium]
MRRAPVVPSAILATCIAALLAGCSGGAQAGPPRATTPSPSPAGVDAQHAAIDALGRRAFEALQVGDPARLLYDDLDLRTLLDASVATRISAQRLGLASRLGDTADFARLLEGAEYAGVCLQGAREVETGGALGLRSPGWVFDRLLVIGRRPTGRRIAAWIEGVWLYTDVGFWALDLERVERPRWEHSDLEIAPCDLSIRDDLPGHAR